MKRLFATLTAALFIHSFASAQLPGNFNIDYTDYNYQETYFGPSIPLRWFCEKIDKDSVTYRIDQFQNWVNLLSKRADNSEPVSSEGKHCKYSEGCDCPGFAPITDGKEYQKSYCRHCGHHRQYHR